MENSNKTFEMPYITTVNPGAVPVITMLCSTAKIGEIVNQMVEWDEDRSKISPGLLIESLIVCIFCGCKPLWRVEEFWAKQDLKLLFDGVDVTVDQLNDDAYGCALDKLSEVKMEELVNLCSLVMLTAHDLNISTIHLDTTTKSVQGAYENDAFGDFLITYGHSKDHRPDLKQFKIGAAVQENGHPVMGQIFSGNGPVYLEKPNRIQALGYVFIMVLLISSYLEYRVRKSLKENKQYVLLPGKKKTDRPITKTIMEYFSFIMIVIVNGQRLSPVIAINKL